MPYSGVSWKEHGHGIYRCVCCGTALFRSETKFESGTGWPSFYAPIAQENVAKVTDRSLGIARTEVKCTRCEGHLGHVFDDGPGADRFAVLHELGFHAVREGVVRRRGTR